MLNRYNLLSNIFFNFLILLKIAPSLLAAGISITDEIPQMADVLPVQRVGVINVDGLQAHIREALNKQAEAMDASTKATRAIREAMATLGASRRELYDLEEGAEHVRQGLVAMQNVIAQIGGRTTAEETAATPLNLIQSNSMLSIEELAKNMFYQRGSSIFADAFRHNLKHNTAITCGCGPWFSRVSTTIFNSDEEIVVAAKSIADVLAERFGEQIPKLTLKSLETLLLEVRHLLINTLSSFTDLSNQEEVKSFAYMALSEERKLAFNPTPLQTVDKEGHWNIEGLLYHTGVKIRKPEGGFSYYVRYQNQSRYPALCSKGMNPLSPHILSKVWKYGYRVEPQSTESGLKEKGYIQIAPSEAYKEEDELLRSVITSLNASLGSSAQISQTASRAGPTVTSVPAEAQGVPGADVGLETSGPVTSNVTSEPAVVSAPTSSSTVAPS